MLKIWSDLGGDIRATSPHRDWEAIHWAVGAGNSETFDVLLDEYEDAIGSIVDACGWSLLHLAARRTCLGPPTDQAFDSMKIIRRLLECGCDPAQKTPPTMAYGHDGGKYTPGDFACKVGPEFHQAYRQILADLQMQVAFELGVDTDSSEDEYFDCA